MAEPSIASLIGNLTPDSVRSTLPFSIDLANASQEMFEANSDSEVSKALRRWLIRGQPCTFAKIAAGPADLISFCVLTDRDLAQPDSTIREKIQNHRLEWKRAGFLQQKSAFIILALSERIMLAEPNAALRALALRLAELYLLEQIEADRVYHDRILLKVLPEETREWVVGVNFFGSQGDGRWWHDHRIPGGIALSMNSVGHLIRASAELSTTVDPTGRTQGQRRPVDSLDAGLRNAMLSIRNASNTVSGKATSLRSVENMDPSLRNECPFSAVPPELREFDWRKYSGWYDTDHSIPSGIFRPDIERPHDVREFELDFTYLHDARNVDYYRTGPGVRIL